MNRPLRAMLLLGALLLAMVAALPWLAYQVELAGVEGRPEAAAALPLSVEQQNWLRCELHAGDRDQAVLTNPWRAALDYLSARTTIRYGDRLAWLVARDHVAHHAGAAGAQRDLPAAALSVWVARHWTLEQMEARAHALLQHAGPHQCPPGPAEWPQALPGT